MAKTKLHVMVGQGLIDGPCTVAYITANQDPLEQWYGASANTAIWDLHAGLGSGALVFPYSPLKSNNWWNSAAHPDYGVAAGPDIGFMRRVGLLDATNIHCMVKLSGTGVLRAGSSASGRWDKAAGDLYDDVAPAVNAARANLASVIPGNPVEIGSITLCFGYFEAADYLGVPSTAGADHMADDLTTLIGNLRTDLSALTGQNGDDIPVMLWRLPHWSKIGQGGSYADIAVDIIRNAVLGVAVTLDNVGVIDIDATANVNDHIYTTSRGTFDAGEAMGDTYQRLTDPSVPAAVDGGIPVVVYAGQSNVGGSTSALFLNSFYNGDPTLVQDYDGKVWTYDWTGDDVETYDPETNSNTGPDPTWNGSGNWGPDVGLTPLLLGRHADTGFCWFKLGVNGSSIGPNTSSSPVWLKRYAALPKAVWPTYEAGWRSFVRKCIDATGRVPDVRLIIWHQGESDTEAALHPLYESNLREHIANLRELHATNTRAADSIPVGIVKTKNNPGNPWGAGLSVVRAAQVTVGAEAGNFLIDVDDTPYRVDFIHDSGEGSLQVGRKVDAAIPAYYESGDATGG